MTRTASRIGCKVPDPALAQMQSSWISILLWLSLSALLMTSLLSLGTLFLLRQAGWWRTHTFEAIHRLNSLELALANSEAQHPAPVARSRAEKIAAERAELARAAQMLKIVRELMNDNPLQQNLGRQMEKLLASRLRKEGNMVEPYADFRSDLQRMKAEEERLLLERSRRLERVRTVALYLGVGLLLFSVVSFLILSARQRRESKWVTSVLHRLSSAEARFNAFMDHSPLLAFIRDEQAGIVYANRAWHSFEASLPPGVRDPFAMGLADPEAWPGRTCLPMEKGQKHPTEIAGRDGTVHEWLTVRFPFRTEDGPLLVGALAMDVTESRRTERALEKSERRLRLALESAAMQVWEYDAKRDQVESFFAGLKPSEGPVSELLTLDEAMQFVSAECRDRVKQELRAAAESHGQYSATYQTTAGRWMVSSGRANEGEERPARVFGVAQDQTERIEAEQRLAKLTKLNESILKSTHLALISIGIDGVVTSFNAAAERLLDQRAEEVVGLGTLDWWQQSGEPVSLPGKRAAEQPAISSVSEEVQERIFTRKDKSKVPVRVTVTPIHSEAGELTGYLLHLTDLSELRHASRQVEELNGALQNTLSGWAQLDSKGCYVSVNRSYAQASGYRPEEMTGLHWEKTVHPEDLDTVREAFETMAKTGSGRAKARGIRKDGSIFHQMVYLAAAHDYLGQRVGSYCFLRDETREVEAELRLGKSEKRYRQLFELNPLPAWIYNPKTLEFVDVNEAAIRHYGYPRERFMSLHLTAVRAGENADQIERALTEAARSGAATAGVWQHRLSDGRLIDVELASRDLSDTARLVMVRDVTEERRAQARLRRSESLLREAQEIAQVGIWEFDTKTGATTWSPEISQIFGRDVTEESLNYEGFLESVHPADRERVAAAVQSSIETKRKYDVAYRINRMDGAIRHVLVRGQYTNGTRRCLAGAMIDITEQKEIQDQLEQSLSEKEVLLKEIHHRVKNNLQIISCLLNMHAEKLDGTPAVKALQESERRVMAMALIHERLYGNRRMDRINFQEYTQTLVDSLVESYAASRAQIAACFELDPIELTIEQAIPCGLILNELVTNALKYAYPGDGSGELFIAMKALAGKQVRLSVTDQGRGLPEGFKLGNSRSLGMTIIQLLTKQLGGQLEVQSSGQGASFGITFPHLS